MIRRAALVAVVALAAVALVGIVWRRGTLPPFVTVEDVVAALSAPAAGGRLQPGDPLRGDGPRQSLLAPPPSLRPKTPPRIAPAIAAGCVRHIANAVNWGAAAPRPEELAHLRDLYTAEVRGWDDAFASLLRGLDRLGVLGSTVIVVTADHGEEFHEHGHLTHGAHLYDESVRVPPVIADPGIPAAGRRDVAQGIDVFPTVAALLGVATPPGLAGRDVVAAVASDEDRPVVSETARGIAPDGRPVRIVSVRSRGWKLIHTPALGRFELYDLANDVGERDDRYGVAPEGARLAGLLQRWEASAAAPPASDGGDPALDAKLRALGYVE